MWTMRPSGVFERTLDKVTGHSLEIIDLDDDVSQEVIVHGTTRFTHHAGSYYWLGGLPHIKDILAWDGERYTRARAEVTRPHIRQNARALVASYLDPYRFPPPFTKEVAKLDMMAAIESCYYWGVAGLGDELLDRYEHELRDGEGAYDDKFAEGVDRLIAKWRSGSALGGYAYGDRE